MRLNLRWWLRPRAVILAGLALLCAQIVQIDWTAACWRTLASARDDSGTLDRSRTVMPAATRRGGGILDSSGFLGLVALRCVPGLILGLLALPRPARAGPGLRRGFLLSYDMVFVPREPFTPAMFGLVGGPPRAVPSDFAVAVATRVVPADIVQKLVLL